MFLDSVKVWSMKLFSDIREVRSKCLFALSEKIVSLHIDYAPL